MEDTDRRAARITPAALRPGVRKPGIEMILPLTVSGMQRVWKDSSHQSNELQVLVLSEKKRRPKGGIVVYVR